MFSKFVVEELDWSAKSPDLNSIQHLSEELEQRPEARTYDPTSVLDLTDALVAEWEQISAEGSTSGGKTETRRVEAVTAAH